MADMLLVGREGYHEKYNRLAAAVDDATKKMEDAGMKVMHKENRVRGSTAFTIEDPSARIQKMLKKCGHGPSPAFNLNSPFPDRVQSGFLMSMTPLVCFNFCRTIEQMLYFGLIYGRECYCTPYYERTPGKGVCDLPCEGDSRSICGGKHMTSMYEMHMCADTGNDLQNALDASEDVHQIADGVGSNATTFARALERSADWMKMIANRGGDMTSHALGQKAKVWAGDLLHAGERATAAAVALNTENGVARGLLSADFSIADNAYAAEESMRKISSLSAEASAAAEEADPMASATHPEITAIDTGRAVPLFMGVMQVVDHWQPKRDERAHEKPQTTCEGELAGEPIVGLDYGACAEACDRHAPKSSDDFCVAFNHYTLGHEEPLCFLLKGIKSVWEYDCSYVIVNENGAQDIDDGESLPPATSPAPTDAPATTSAPTTPAPVAPRDNCDRYSMADRPNSRIAPAGHHFAYDCLYMDMNPMYCPAADWSAWEQWTAAGLAPAWMGELSIDDSGLTPMDCCVCQQIHISFFGENYSPDDKIGGLAFCEAVEGSQFMQDMVVMPYSDVTTLYWYPPSANMYQQECPAGSLDFQVYEGANPALNLLHGNSTQGVGALKKHTLAHEKSEKARKSKKAGKNEAQLALIMNHCAVRGEWALETPVKPEVNFLDRCFGEQLGGTEI